MKLRYLLLLLMVVLTNELCAQKSSDKNSKGMDKSFLLNVSAACVPWKGQVYQHYFISGEYKLKPNISAIFGQSFSKGYLPITLFTSAKSFVTFVGMNYAFNVKERIVIKPFLLLGYNHIIFSPSVTGARFNGLISELGFIPEYKLGAFGVGFLARIGLAAGKYNQPYSPSGNLNYGNQLRFLLNGVHVGLNFSFQFNQKSPSQ